MTFLRLLCLNLLYHRRGNFAVFLGVALGTAVLTGALLVGDSLRGSLRELALDQLGWVEQGMVANRFFREKLAEEIEARHISPVILLQGNAVSRGDGPLTPAPLPGGERGIARGRSVNKVTVLGVDERFWAREQMPIGQDFWRGETSEAILNSTLAEALKIQAGDTIGLRVQKAENIPRETLLGKRNQENVVQTIQVKVKQILPDQGMARFTLRPNPEPAHNVFVPLRFLQNTLDLAGKANVLLVAGTGPDMAKELHRHLTLEDWNLQLRSPAERARALVKFLAPRNEEGLLKRARWLGRVPDELAGQAQNGILTEDQVIRYYREHHPYYLLESRQMLLEDAVVKAVEGEPLFISNMAPFKLFLDATLIYLADSISDGKNEIPYGIVAAQKAYPPYQDLGLEGNQLDLADYPGSPLKAGPGDPITLEYYAPDDHNRLTRHKEDFVVRKLFKLEGRFDDPDLVPEFPGITDKLDMGSWVNPPFPYNPRRIKFADESFWKRYRTTPRAYISLETAQRLWGSRFGKVTSIRLMPPKDMQDPEKDMKYYGDLLQSQLQPKLGGFVFQDVRAQGQQAGGGATDFGVLFLSFSFFLIISALLLVGLLFRLNLDLRSQEMGILLATGWTHSQVRRLLLGEGALLALLGSLAGLGGAMVYANQLLHYLGRKWPGEQNLNFLQLHWTGETFVTGLTASLLVSLATIFWATRVLSKMAPRSLLAGETTASALDFSSAGKIRWSLWLALLFLVGALGCLVGGFFVQDQEARAGCFFGSGFLLLAVFLIGTWRGLRRTGRHSNPRQSLAGLGIRNAGRHAVRSLLTVGLLGSATFLIVAVESFHKEANRAFYERTGGSGGFPLYGETDVPIFQDLNDPSVRGQLPFPKDTGPLLDQVRVYPCRLQAGDDASCLNLYQPLKPRILGVPRTLIERGGFHFAGSLAETAQERDNPWLLLEKTSGDVFPVFADANTAQWILKVPLGGTFEMNDDQGNKVRLQIVGLLQESIFQSELVMAEQNFRRVFPRREGFSFFLVDCPREKSEQVQSAWGTALAANGLAMQPTAKRLENYLKVENTYLSTFQALGGLGLLLGAAGLAIVLLRGIWERRGELALLRAMGFRRQRLAWLVLAENAFLLLVGLGVGTVAALVAVAPHLAGNEAPNLGLRITELLALVILVGLAAGWAAVVTTLRAPLLSALRRE